jgi:phosphate-selective porin
MNSPIFFVPSKPVVAVHSARATLVSFSFALVFFVLSVMSAEAQTGAAPSVQGAVEAGYDNGFFVRTLDKRFSIVANGFIQARLTVVPLSNGFPNYNFDLALGRLAFSGNVFDPNLTYFFQYEGSTFGNNNVVTMLDWWLAYRFSQAFTLRMGRMILPFSRQFYTHPGNLLFTDLSATDYAFNLQRSLGVEASGDLGFMQYHLVLMNSVRALDAGTQSNVGNVVSALARVEVPILKPYGYMESQPSNATEPQLSVGAAIAVNAVASDSRFQNTVFGDRTLNVTFDAGFRTGGLSVQGAYHVRPEILLIASGNVFRTDNGFYAQAGYYLTPQFELAARYATVRFERALTPSVRTTLSSLLNPNAQQNEITLGANYYFHKHGAKIQLDGSLLENTGFGGGRSSSYRVRLQTQLLF